MAPALSPLDLSIRELESRIDRLRALYEQYFMGIERIEPNVARNDVEKRIVDLRKVKFNNTAKRFKFQTLVQRYNTMQQYWTRTCREIENGTYRRQKLRAEKRFGSVSDVKEELAHADDPAFNADKAQSINTEVTQDLQALLDADVDLEQELAAALQAAKSTALPLSPTPSVTVDSLKPLSTLSQEPSSRLIPSSSLQGVPTSGGLLSKLGKGMPPNAQATAANERQKPQKPQKPKPRSPTPAREMTSPATMSSERIQTLHKAYLAARRKTNARDVSYEKLERKIREAEKNLTASHQGRSVDFEVTIKNGKAILKPKLK